MIHEACTTPLMNPRERCGHISIASAAPAGHSAPMPMPSNVRKINRNTKVGENPAMKLQTEIPENRDHQWGFAPDPIGEQTRTDGPHQPHPQSQRKDDGDFSGWYAEFIGDRLDDQQEHSEIKGIERPAQPRRPLGRLPPPGNVPYRLDRCYPSTSLYLTTPFPRDASSTIRVAF